MQREISWKRINQLAEEKASFQESVIGVNTGGLFVEVEGIKAFCPGSHIPQVGYNMFKRIKEEYKFSL